MKAWIKSAEADGVPIPKPKSFHQYSGQFRMRLPKSLHAKLSETAEIEGVSLNTLAISYLSERVGYHSGGSKTDEQTGSF